MIKIKFNESPNIIPCKMLCDECLHDKLNAYDLTTFMNSHETNLFIGKPKSGKTSLLYSFFKSPKLFRKVFHNIFLFQPSHSRASMKDNLFGKIPDDQKFDELDEASLEIVMNTIKCEDKKYNNCIIFDDMTAYLKNHETLKLFKELIYNRRHYRTSIFFLVQTWYSIHSDIRKLFSNIFIFRVNKREMQSIFEEVIEGKEKHRDEICKLVYNEPYKYLFVNLNSQRFFDGFNELLIDEDENNI
jgi:hypothetical protein